MTDITFVLPRLDPTGGAKVIIQLAHFLTENGHNVKVTSPLFPFRGKYNINHLHQAIKEWGYDVSTSKYISRTEIGRSGAVIATNFDTAYTVNKVVGSQGIFFIQSYDQWPLFEDPEFWGWIGNFSALAPTYLPTDKKKAELKRYVDEAYKLPLRKIVVSKWLERVLKYITDDPVTHIPVGVDFPPLAVVPHRLDSDPIVISYILRGYDYRGDSWAKEIHAKVASEYPGVIFNPVQNVSYSELVEMYLNTDIFLYTSRIEGFGLPPLEAMAHSCMICANGVGAIPEYVPAPEHQVGYTKEGLTDKLRLLIDNYPIPKFCGWNYEASKKWDIRRTVEDLEHYLGCQV